jgi:putative peptidoglycan lipid II flippase
LSQPTTPSPDLPAIARAASIIAIGNIASRLLGLVREIVKARLFGASGQVDALNIALIVPIQIYELATGGVVNSALVPVFSEYTAPERRSELWRLASILLTLTAVALSLLMILALLFAPLIARLLSGAPDAASASLETALLRITLPAVVFLSLSGIVSGLLYSLKRFTLPAFTAAAFNASMVIFALTFASQWGVQAMAAGLFFGAVLQLAVQLPALRDGFRVLRPAFNLDHPGLRRIFALYLPIIVGLIITQASIYIGLGLAYRTGEGGVSWMNYATYIYQFPIGLVATALSFAILPTLAGETADGEFKATLVQGINLVLILILPATVGLFALARPIVALLYERGKFTPEDSLQTARVLQLFLLGLSFAAVDQMLIFAFYARKDTVTPSTVGVVSVIVYLSAAIALRDSLGLFSLMIADSLKQMTHALVTGALLSRRLGGFRRTSLLPTLIKCALASALLGLIAAASLFIFDRLGPSPNLLTRALAVALPGGAAAAAYVFLLSRLNIPEFQLLLTSITKRLSRRPTSNLQLPISNPPISYNSPSMNDRPSLPPDLYTEDYFRNACEGYDEFNETQGERLSRRLAAAFAVAGVTPGMKVLDVGCGRGEIVRHCARLGADAFGVDYAPVAVAMSQMAVATETQAPGKTGIAQSDAKQLPFPNGYFDRALMFDVVEHLYPWELHQAMLEVRRVLKPGGLFVVHTAPNVWYDKYAYPFVRLFRILTGEGAKYPSDPRALNVAVNLEVHVNEQSGLSLWSGLRRAGFRTKKVWLDSPPQNRNEGAVLAAARAVLFRWPPFRWFFEREVFAVAEKGRSIERPYERNHERPSSR